jgi:hypothetical protein
MKMGKRYFMSRFMDLWKGWPPIAEKLKLVLRGFLFFLLLFSLCVAAFFFFLFWGVEALEVNLYKWKKSVRQSSFELISQVLGFKKVLNFALSDCVVGGTPLQAEGEVGKGINVLSKIKKVESASTSSELFTQAKQSKNTRHNSQSKKNK